MVLITEYRVVMPMTVEEYQVAQLWSVAEASKNETGGGEGIEVLNNEPFDLADPDMKEDMKPESVLLDESYTKGQYTKKIYHLRSRLPKMITSWISENSQKLDIYELAWNAFPYCRTIVTNPHYMKDGFMIKIESLHLNDNGNTENAHNLTPEQLAKRKVVTIDIANDTVKTGDYKEEWDPAKYKSEKTGRGPLDDNWINTVQPVMTCYKLVTCKFEWRVIGSRVENLIINTERRIFTNFHRQVFCWTDNWHGLTMEDIRAIEDKTKDELDKQIKEGNIKGTTGELE